MRRVLSALALAAATITLALPAAAGDACADAISSQEQRVKDATAAIAADKELAEKLVATAAAREKAADQKEKLASDFKAAAGKQLDMKKKGALLELASDLESDARADRAFAKDRRDLASLVEKARKVAEVALDKHQRVLAMLKDKCGK